LRVGCSNAPAMYALPLILIVFPFALRLAERTLRFAERQTPAGHGSAAFDRVSGMAGCCAD